MCIHNSLSTIIPSQVKALQQHYANLTPNEVALKKADFIGFTLIPTLASGFVAGYWIIGMMKYHSPDWSAYTFLVPDFQATFDKNPEIFDDI